jgi:hypothetical protein
MNANAATPPSSAESTTDASSGTTTPSSSPASPKPWSGLGYEPVPGLMNRIIARYLRGQRKNMERFFQERGLLESAERMRQIRLSRQGMMAKNRMFQEVLGEYARGATLGATPTATAEADDQQVTANQHVDLSSAEQPVSDSNGVRPDASDSVSELASGDGAGIVIEE